MREVMGVIIAIIGILSGIYIGGWLMFVQPIIEACQCFDAGTLTGVMVGITVIKCIFAAAVGSIIAYLGVFIGMIVGDVY